MKRLLLICFCIALLACAPTQQPIESYIPVWTEPAAIQESTPPKSEETAQVPPPSPKSAKEAALLYRGDRINLYAGRSETELGVCIERLQAEEPTILYQPLPGTEGLDSLSLLNILPEEDANISGDRVILRYLDAEGKERGLCIFDRFSERVFSYPVSNATEITITEDLQSAFDDIMLIGFLYEDFQNDYANMSRDYWEALCQRRILDALYYNYHDVLPPYLHGDLYGEHSSFVTQAELDGFFRSTVNRPNLVLDRMNIDEEVPDLLPGQVPLWPTDWCAWANVTQAVFLSDGEYLLYGYAHIGNIGFYPQGVICHVTAVNDYLGWRVENTEMIPKPTKYAEYDIAFAPTS